MEKNNFSNLLNSKVLLVFLAVINLHTRRCVGFPKKIESWLDDVQKVEGVCVPSGKECDFDSIFYSFDGSCNNKDYPTAGQAQTPLARILPALYSDDDYQDRLAADGQPLPLPRLVRTTLLPNDFKPTNSINILFEGIGQFLTHDTTRSRVDFSDPQLACCDTNNAPIEPIPDKCRPIIIPADDPFYKQFGVTCLPGRRLINTNTLGCKAKPVLFINDQSAYLDLSFVYSPDEKMAKELRADDGGLMKVVNDESSNNQNLPPITNGNEKCPLGGITPQPGSDCIFGGDFRLNQNIELSIPDILFVNFHNYLATALKEINQQWSSDELYLNARRIATASYQHMLLNEYVTLLIGPVVALFYNLLPSWGGYSNCYNSKLNPQTFHSFAAAASRVSHSTINGVFGYTGPEGEPEEYRLREKLFNNQFLYQKNGFLSMVQALTTQSCDTQDQFFSEEVTNHLFEAAGAGFGNDLQSIDINRGRETGLQGYNAFRQLCGYNALQSFEEFYAIVTLPEYVDKLKTLYTNVEDVDLYVVLALERPVHGTLGEVGACIVGAQLYHYKCSDRLWHEFETAKFSIEQLNSIRSITLSSIICSALPEIANIRKLSLLVESANNPVIPCDQTPKIDLNLWKV